jgi:hypothetical protein
MRFIYKGTKYEYNEDKLTFAEAKAFEKVAGATIPALQTGRAERDSQVIQAMMWSAMKRQEPTLKYEDLEEITFEEFEFLPDDEPADPGTGDEPVDPSAPPDPRGAVELPGPTPTANDDERLLADSTGSG